MQKNSFNADTAIPSIGATHFFNAPQPTAFPPVDTSFMPLMVAFNLCPGLGELVLKLVDHCKVNGLPLGQGISVIADARALRQLLPEANPRRNILVISLLNEKNADIDQAVGQQPSCFNFLSADLMDNTTYHSWSYLSDEDHKDIWLPDAQLLPLWKSYHWNLDEDSGNAITEWVPVVMIKGCSVAVGGFWLTKNYLDCAQSARKIAGENWDPYQRFSLEQLIEAEAIAKKLGPQPSCLEYCETSPGKFVVKSTVIDARGWVDEPRQNH